MFKDNSWYTHRKILSDYCKCDDVPIYGTIQHGWFKIKESEINELKLSLFPNCPLFCWSGNIKEQYYKNDIKNVIPIGAPFIYLADNFDEKIEIKNNVIVFPPHSDFENDQPSGFKDTEQLIEEIEKKFVGPYSVCLFYQDINDQIEKLYKSKNWKIFCCGNRFHPEFLNNFIRFVKSSNNVVVYELTSASLYSLYLKINTFFFKSKKINRNYFGDEVNLHEYDEFDNLKFLSDENVKMEKKIELANEILGKKYKKSEKELANILGLNSIVKIKIASTMRKIKILFNLF